MGRERREGEGEDRERKTDGGSDDVVLLIRLFRGPIADRSVVTKRMFAAISPVRECR